MINDPSPNAFATGRNQEHATVAVTSGLLHILNKNELEGVIAHELSHIGNKRHPHFYHCRDFGRLRGASFRFFSYGRNFSEAEEMTEGGGQAQLIMMLVGIVLAILAPIIAMLIQLAISRRREFLAELRRF